MNAARQARAEQLSRAAELLRVADQENNARDARIASLTADLAARQAQIDGLEARLLIVEGERLQRKQAYELAREHLAQLGNLI